MSSIKGACSSRTSPRLHCGVVILRILLHLHHGDLFFNNISHQHLTAHSSVTFDNSSFDFQKILNFQKYSWSSSIGLGLDLTIIESYQIFNLGANNVRMVHINLNFKFKLNLP